MKTRPAIILIMAMLTLHGQAAAQTRELLEAPTVKSRIRVQWDPTKKHMTWAVDEGARFREIPADALFLTKTSIFVTYPRLNPLRLQATTSVTSADDPSSAAIAKLIESIVSVVTTLRPDAANRATGDVPAGAVCTDIKNLSAALADEKAQAPSLRKQLARWITTIDEGFDTKKSGAEAVRSAINLITAENAERGLLPELDEIIKRATTLVEKVEGGAMNPPADCEETFYRLALMSNPRARIQQIQALRAAVLQLVELLRTQYAVDFKWEGIDFTISDEILPTPDKMRNVTVKVTHVSVKFDDVSGALTIANQESGSAAFSVRRYTALVPEIGVGAVFGFIEQPKYGTAKDQAGETIVALVPDDQVSIQPSVLVNFVCRCALGPLAPMAQVGAAASKDAPGILVGGGLRLFGAGKGDVAIGGGLMFAWVKDLQQLKVGDVVTGTRDIEADLGYTSRPKTTGYFVIQYKF